MDMEKTHGPEEGRPEAESTSEPEITPVSASPFASMDPDALLAPDTAESEVQLTEDPFAMENTPEQESREDPVVICPGDDHSAEENTDVTTADTVFFSPVAAAETESGDATQVLPTADELLNLLNKNSRPDEEDPLAGIAELLGDETPESKPAPEETEPEEKTGEPERELTPDELKAQKKAQRKARRAARRARLDEEEVPRTDTFWRKLWYILRLGDGLFGIPHILATVVWLVLVFAIGTSLGRTLWLCAADVLALGKTPHEITITIDTDDELEDVAQKLHDAGLIRYPGLFLKFAEFTEKGENIIKDTSITFGSEHVYDYNALINALSFKGGSVITLEVTIPEGYSCAQIFALLEEKGVCSAKSLEAYCEKGGPYNYWFIQEIPEEYLKHKYGLEGFLFPDTYEFYMDDEPDRVIEKFLDNFNAKFTQRMVDKFIAMLGETELDLSLYEVVIMASIVEKEKAADLEGYAIASVFYNRLRKPSVYPFLDSDATINYAIDYYNKGELITDEQINASPYHTYKSPGLTPTPIANPGLSSLDAALDPYGDTAQKDQYYFFVLNRETNRHEFSVTLDEHNRKLKQLGYLD